MRKSMIEASSYLYQESYIPTDSNLYDNHLYLVRLDQKTGITNLDGYETKVSFSAVLNGKTVLKIIGNLTRGADKIDISKSEQSMDRFIQIPMVNEALGESVWEEEGMNVECTLYNYYFRSEFDENLMNYATLSFTHTRWQGMENASHYEGKEYITDNYNYFNEKRGKKKNTK